MRNNRHKRRRFKACTRCEMATANRSPTICNFCRANDLPETVVLTEEAIARLCAAYTDGVEISDMVSRFGLSPDAVHDIARSRGAVRGEVWGIGPGMMARVPSDSWLGQELRKKRRLKEAA